MQIVRKIIYTGDEAQLVRQMRDSLCDGIYPKWLTHIEVTTIEVPDSDVIKAAIRLNQGGWMRHLDERAKRKVESCTWCNVFAPDHWNFCGMCGKRLGEKGGE